VVVTFDSTDTASQRDNPCAVLRFRDKSTRFLRTQTTIPLHAFRCYGVSESTIHIGKTSVLITSTSIGVSKSDSGASEF